MSRRPALVPPPVLDPRAVFTRLSATAALGLKPSTLATEIRRGRLRVSRRAGRYFILGKWLLEWIERGETSSRREDKTVEPRIEPRIKRSDFREKTHKVMEDKEL